MEHTVEIGSNSRGSSPDLATFEINWGGPGFASYQGKMDATPGAPATSIPATTSADGGGAGAAPSASPAQAAPAAPPAATGSPAATPGAAPGAAAPDNDANLRALRTNYETLKPWETAARAGIKPEQALEYHTTITAMHTEGTDLAAALGYTPESFAEAFKSDPVDTLSTLRSEYKAKNPGAADPRQLENLVKKHVAPIQETLNKQQTEAAVQRYTTEITRLNSDPTIGFGADVPEVVSNAMWDIMDMITPNEVLAEIKSSGKVAALLPYYNQAKTTFLSIVNGFNEYSARGAGGQPGQGGGGGTGRPGALAPAAGAAKELSQLTIDDIINDPGRLPGIKAGAY